MSIEISKLSRLAKAPDTFTVEFHDDGKLTVNAALVADYNLYSGRILIESEYEALEKDARLHSAKARALRILGRRPMSRREITERLIQKGESEETACTVADWLVKTGVIDDSEYASMIVRHYSSKGYGLMRIRNELYRHGIGRELWDEALAELPDMEEAAYKAITLKLKGKKPDTTELGRVTKALYRRGFVWNEIRSAAERYMNSEDFDTIE